MAILSIQSAVAYGHVGNTASVFALQRLGIAVWAVNTVQFSNHPGYGAWTGEAVPAQSVRTLVDGVATLGVLPQCQAVLSGYLGQAETGAAVLHAVAQVRAANAAALYCCDPVIGDDGAGVYVRPGVPEFLHAHCLPQADILTPNHFELEHLTGQRVTTLATAKSATDRLLAAMRPGGLVLVTSLRIDDTPGGATDLLAACADGHYRTRTPLLPFAASGTGDLCAAVFLLHRLRGATPGDAMAAAASAVFSVLQRTYGAGSREMLIVEAQQELITPSCIFGFTVC